MNDTPAGTRPSSVPASVAEAAGQLRDLWQHVRGFRKLYPYRYPAGSWAIWLVLSEPNDATPNEWMGVPVVVLVER